MSLVWFPVSHLSNWVEWLTEIVSKGRLLGLGKNGAKLILDPLNLKHIPVSEFQLTVWEIYLELNIQM